MRSSYWSSYVCSSYLDQLLLRGQGKVGDVAAGLLADRIEARELQPVGMDVQLNLVPARHERVDDRLDDLGAIDERGHRIDEEIALDPVRLEHVHLIFDPEIAVAAAAEDRAFDIGTRIDALLTKGNRTDRNGVVMVKCGPGRGDHG